MPENRFLNHMHYFRAFAILNIVIVHLWCIPSEYQKHHGVQLINIIREVTFHASTIYFLFISGFLFYYLSPKFQIVKYYKSKLFNVIFPYCFITITIMLIKKGPLIASDETSITHFFTTLGWTLINGKIQMPYWYIPFISIVFLVSPLILKFSVNTFRQIVLIFALLPLLGLRTGTHISIFQYSYFFPIYLMGVYAAMDYSTFLMLIKDHKRALIAVSAISTILLIFINIKSINLTFGVMDLKESIYYVQKLSVCFLAILALLKLENKKIVLFDIIATYSFAIYFTHTLVGKNAIMDWYYDHIFSRTPELLLPLSIFYVCFTFFSTLFICMGIKKVIGKNSRLFIGA